MPVEVTFRLSDADIDDKETSPRRTWIQVGRVYNFELNAVRAAGYSTGSMELSAVFPPEGSLLSGDTVYVGDDASHLMNALVRFDRAGTYEIKIFARHPATGFVTQSFLRVTAVDSAQDIKKVRAARTREAGKPVELAVSELRQALDGPREAAPAGYAQINGVAVTYPFADGRRYPLRGIEIELWEQGGAKLAGPIHTVEATTAGRCGLDRSANYVDSSGVWQHTDNSGYFDFGNIPVASTKNVYFKLRFKFYAGGDGLTSGGVEKSRVYDSIAAAVVEYSTAPFTAASTGSYLMNVYGPNLGTAGTTADEATHIFYDVARTFGYFRDCNGYTNGLVPAYVNLTDANSPYSTGSAIYMNAWNNSYLTNEITSSIMHEYAHTIQWSMRGGSFPSMGSGDRNHGGCANSDSSDGVVEGWARFAPAMIANDPVYRWGAGEGLDLSVNASTSACDKDEYMVGGTLWDLWTESGIELVESMREISKTLELRDPNLFKEFYDRYIADWGRCSATWTIFNNHNAGYPNTCGLGTPSNPSPASGASGVATATALTWTAAAGATSYDVYFGTAATPGLAGTVTAASYNPGALTAGTTYYWRVVAKDASTSATSATWSFSTQSSLAAPVLLAPSSGATGVSLTPTLSWAASSGATSYDVYLGTAASPALAANVTATSYTSPALAAGTTYYWRIVAKNATGSVTTATLSFTTQSGLAAPVLLGPASGATDVSLTPTLSWAASTGATSYDVYLGTAASPALAANVTATSYTSPALAAGTTYYWRIVAKNTADSVTTATLSFTTQSALAAPALLSPASGGTGLATTTTLNWSASTGATSYDVYFGTAATPALAVTVTTTGYNPGTLTAGTTYYWRVVAKNASTSATSSTWSFTTESTLAAPVMLGPAGGGTGISLTPTLSWSASTGATSYDVYLGTQASPALVANVTGTGYTSTALSAGTTYYWRIVAKNATASATTATLSFTTQAGLAAPALLSPASGATGLTTTLTLSWSASAGATSYDVYFGTSATPALAGTVTTTGYNPGALAAGTTYYWRIAAKNATTSASSATWSFTTQSALGAPALLSPASGATGLATTITLSWSAPAGATSYDVYFGTAATPGLIGTVATTSYNPGTLTAGTTYYWRIAARNATTAVSSATWSFTTQTPLAAPVLLGPPASGTGISLTPTLSWMASTGATSYDVYLGTAASPALVANVTGTSYASGVLAAGTTYNWRIVARNATASATSAILPFTTTAAIAPVPPGAPSGLVPLSGATGVSRTAVLQWSAATGATSYEVRLGTTNPPPVYIASTTATSIALTPLTTGATYYWQVIAKNSAGSTASPVLTFTVTTISSASNQKVGAYREGAWYMDVNGSGGWDAGDRATGWGSATAIPVVGDWNGDGKSEIGVYDQGIWYLDTNGNGYWDAGDLAFGWGSKNGIPVLGDWNGDGRTKVGVFEPGGIWYLDTNGSTIWDAGDKAFYWGSSSSIPVVGDWNGDGKTKAGIFAAGSWYLDYNGSGIWDSGDRAFGWGTADAIPVVGDWNGDRRTKIGVFQKGTWYLDINGSNVWDSADKAFVYGSASSTPIVGDWNGDGRTKVGIFEAGQWRMDKDGNYLADAGDTVISWGAVGDKAVMGKW